MDSIKFSDEVKHAQENNIPIVALESTIITHGMPYPDNLKTARLVENSIRKIGAVPATISVMNGFINVGMTDNQLREFSQTRDSIKLSRADLAICLSSKQTGSTTVAATMIIAKLTNIEVFATGGIGGAHPGSETSFDISADLYELSKTAVNVVCSGPKAILDIPKTLEILESLGVPVITYRQNHLPAFWSSSSEIKSPFMMDSITEIANSFIYRKKIQLEGGQLIANPVPRDFEIPQHEISIHIKEALEEADATKVVGKSLTPFLLNKIFEKTKGASLKANTALIINNAKLAAQLAISLKKLQKA